MQVVLLAGGLGTRLQEETRVRPKPMVEIGGKPILWHIMKHYRHFGCRDFVIALGYLGNFIKQYFLDATQLSGDLHINMATGETHRTGAEPEDWRIGLVDTGTHTWTGSRVKRLEEWIRPETFMVTYGDGVADVDLHELFRFHKRQKRIATVTAVRPPARFGGLILDGNTVASFTEKPSAGEGWINGGFLVLEPQIFQYLATDDCSLEADVLERLAEEGQLAAYRHDRFWQCMDTLREKHYLEELWSSGQAPWKTWDTASRPLSQVPWRRAA